MREEGAVDETDSDAEDWPIRMSLWLCAFQEPNEMAEALAAMMSAAPWQDLFEDLFGEAMPAR